MAHPVYVRESICKRSSVDDRESYTEGFRRMNSISSFPTPFDSPLLAQRSCRSSTLEAQQPSSPRTIYQYPFALLLYIYARAVRSRWKNTDHFLAFFVGQRHFTDIFHPLALPLSFSSPIEATIDPECSRLFKIG